VHAGCLALTHADDEFERGQLRRHRLQHRQVVRRAQPLRRDHRAAARQLQRVFQLRQTVRRVDVDQHDPDARGGELRDEPLDAVRRPDAQPVTTPQAERPQPRRQPIDLDQELAPRPAHALLAEHDGLAVAEAGHRLAEQAGNGAHGQGWLRCPSDMAEAMQRKHTRILRRHVCLQSEPGTIIELYSKQGLRANPENLHIL